MRLLLDHHISPRVAAAFKRFGGRSEIAHMRDWHGGIYVQQHGEGDLPWLRVAGREQWVIVTGDRNTLLGDLALLYEEGGYLPGFAAIDPERLADIGWIARKLVAIEKAFASASAGNVQVFC